MCNDGAVTDFDLKDIAEAIEAWCGRCPQIMAKPLQIVATIATPGHAKGEWVRAVFDLTGSRLPVSVVVEDLKKQFVLAGEFCVEEGHANPFADAH